MREYARLLLVGAGTLAMAAPGFAQEVSPDAEASAATGGEIIVTAQRKTELLQDVPIAVSSFSQAALDKSRLESAGNLALSVPNLNYSAQLYGASNFSIRGIGYTLVTTAGDQGVGVAENYAPIDRARITDAEFFDVERVEVLRGPQGTLYGRNATGGVINIITAKPRLDEIGASITAEYGNYDLARVKGMLNLSSNDKVGLRFAGIFVRRDGVQRNVFTGNDIDDRKFWAFRASVRLEPTERFRVNAMWEHYSANDSRYGQRTACVNDPGPTSVGGVTVTNANARNFLSEGCVQTGIYAPGVLQGNNNSYSTLSGYLVAALGLNVGPIINGDANAGVSQPDDLRQVSLSSDPYNRVTNNNYQLSLELDVTDNLMLSSITNYNTDEVIQGAGLNASTVPFNSTFITPGGVLDDPQLGDSSFLTVENYNDLRQQQWSQEVRLQSDYGGVFDFNLGAFYYETKRQNDVYFFGNGFTIYTAVAVPGAYIDPGFPPSGEGRNYYLSSNRYRLQSKAAFGELYIRPTDKLTLTLGLRYTNDKKTQPSRAIVVVSNAAGGRGIPEGAVQEANFSQWTGRAIVSYDLTPDSMIYASYARGYKGGGFNSAREDGQVQTYAPETVDALEIGTKNMLFDRKLMLNLTGFYYKYNNYQYTILEGLTTATRNVNTKLYGLELEAAFRPVPGLQFDFTGGWLKTKILPGPNNLSVNPWNITNGDPALIALKSTSGACVGEVAAVAGVVALINAGLVSPAALASACPTAAAPNGPYAGSLGLATSTGDPTLPGNITGIDTRQDITGNELPSSPEWSISVGAQYEFDLGDWTITPRADFHYQSGVEGTVYNEADNRSRGWSNVNATLTFASESMGLRFQLWGKNIFNEEAITAVGVNSASLGLTRRIYLLEPRTFGISATKEF